MPSEAECYGLIRKESIEVGAVPARQPLLVGKRTFNQRIDEASFSS